MKLFLASVAAAAFTLPAIAQQRSYFQSSNGSSAVQVSPGGYGVVGEIDAQGTFHGIDTNGVPLNGSQPSTPGVTFFNSDNPAEFNANVPFVRMDALGRVSVDMAKGCETAGRCRPLPHPIQNRTAQAVRLCRDGLIQQAYQLYETTELGDGPMLLAPKVAAGIAFRNHSFEEAAAIARSLIERDGADAAHWCWDDLRQCYANEQEYLADWGTLRAAVPTPSTRLLVAIHSLARGRVDIANAELTALLASSPTDIVARSLLLSLPPVID